MHKNMKSKLGLATVAIAAICGGGWWTSTVVASDHDESPLVKADPAQDITDLYVFESGDNKTTIIVCWAGFNDTGMPMPGKPDKTGVYDASALYAIHVDNSGDLKDDITIYWRFGASADDQIGIKWEGIPGAKDPVIHGVETVYPAGDYARTWAGHVDDPFFFDAGGYLKTLMTGTVSFTGADFLAGLNVTAAAIEIDTDILTAGNKPIQVWTTASRKK